MLIPALSMVLAAAPLLETPVDVQMVMELNGVPVGSVRIGVTEARAFTWTSETLVRRGPVITRYRTEARGQLAEDFTIERLSTRRLEGEVPVRTVFAARHPRGLLVTDVNRNSQTRYDERLVPSSLAVLLLPADERRCIRALDSLTGEAEEVCGQRSGDRVQGTMMGEPFVAELDGGQLRRLELPGQKVVYSRVTELSPTIFAPPDLYGRGFRTSGLMPDASTGPLRIELRLPGAEAFELPTSASQKVEAGEGKVTITWRSSEPRQRQTLGKGNPAGDELDRVALKAKGRARDRWRAARALARHVSEVIVDKRPAAFERSAMEVYEQAQGSCVGHTELYLALAKRLGLPARRAVGLVAHLDRFFAHTWVQVEVNGRWYDVEPTEGEAPARSPRVLLGVGDQEEAAGRLLLRAHELSLRVHP